MTVRNDITSKYTNRKFTYGPEDMEFCEYLFSGNLLIIGVTACEMKFSVIFWDTYIYISGNKLFDDIQ